MLGTELLVHDMLWDCGQCHKDGLQSERSCPELGNPNLYESLEINGEEYQFCPRSLVSVQVLNDISEAMMVDALGALPRSGGLDEQWNLEVEKFAYILRKIRASEWAKIK